MQKDSRVLREEKFMLVFQFKEKRHPLPEEKKGKGKDGKNIQRWKRTNSLHLGSKL